MVWWFWSYTLCKCLYSKSFRMYRAGYNDVEVILYVAIYMLCIVICMFIFSLIYGVLTLTWEFLPRVFGLHSRLHKIVIYRRRHSKRLNHLNGTYVILILIINRKMPSIVFSNQNDLHLDFIYRVTAADSWLFNPKWWELNFLAYGRRQWISFISGWGQSKITSFILSSWIMFRLFYLLVYIFLFIRRCIVAPWVVLLCSQ